MLAQCAPGQARESGLGVEWSGVGRLGFEPRTKRLRGQVYKSRAAFHSIRPYILVGETAQSFAAAWCRSLAQLAPECAEPPALCVHARVPSAWSVNRAVCVDMAPRQRVISTPVRKKDYTEEPKRSSPGSVGTLNIGQGAGASFDNRRPTVRAARRGRRVRPRYRDPI